MASDLLAERNHPMPQDYPEGPPTTPDGVEPNPRQEYPDFRARHHEQQAELRRRLVEFWGRLYLHTPHVFMTKVLVGLNVAVFVVMVLRGVSPAKPTAQDLLPWGANYGPYTLSGQWWRLVTCTFLHFGILHIGFNMWALWSVGPMVERLLGNMGFLVMYLVSGVIGSTVSVLWQPMIVGAGASGAVFGVVGALLGYLVRQRDSVPVVVLAQFKQSLVPFLIYNLLFGLVPGIDMSAHVGGFVAGFVCGLIQSQPLGAPRIGRLPRNILVAVAGPGLAALLLTGLGMPVVDPDAEVRRAGETEKKVLDLVRAADEKMRRGQISPEEFAGLLETQAIPEWSPAREQLLQIRGLPGKAQQRIAKLIEYMEDREQGWKLEAEALRENSPTKMQQAEEKQRAANRLVEQMKGDESEW
jgi:rhomboid protease GluP